jgi:hypothetical protein
MGRTDWHGTMPQVVRLFQRRAKRAVEVAAFSRTSRPTPPSLLTV